MVAMIVALVGSTSIPLLWTRKPKNFPKDTPNVHLRGFILSLKVLHLSNTFFNTWTCSSRFFDFTTMSSTQSSSSWCITSWNIGLVWFVLFHHSISITQFLSLITHHSKYYTRLAPSLNIFHTICGSHICHSLQAFFYLYLYLFIYLFLTKLTEPSEKKKKRRETQNRPKWKKEEEKKIEKKRRNPEQTEKKKRKKRKEKRNPE